MQTLWDRYERDNGVILTQGLNSTEEGTTNNE
jgi:hypothetical protein